MSVAEFMARFGVAKLGQVGHGLAVMVASLDPETASQVDVDQLEAKYLEFGRSIAKYEPDEERTHAEMKALQDQLERAKSAGQIIAGQLAAAQTAGNTAQITLFTSKVTEIADKIEEIGGEEGDGSASGTLFDAIRDHLQSENDLHEVQALHEAAATTLANAKKVRERKIAELARADRDVEREQARLDRAKEISGLKTSMQAGSIGLDLMSETLAKKKQTARAMAINADGLNQVKQAAQSTDDLIASTLAGAAPAPASALDRLNRLTKKAAA